MEPTFDDRILLCSDCHSHFVFTAGEQLFFHDKQFKNDPKRCKPCKSRRSGLAAVANGTGLAAAGLARTETRTECSECGVQTTVPFKPTQGRPVLCRQCFQVKTRAVAAQASLQMTSLPVAAMQEAATSMTEAQTISALTEASTNSYGAILSPDAAVLAAASMAAAHAHSSVATAADLASISHLERLDSIPVELLASGQVEMLPAELLAAAAEAPEA